MTRKCRAKIELQVFLGVEVKRRKALGVYMMCGMNRGEGLFCFFGVVAIGFKPGQPEYRRPVRGMANACEGKRTMQGSFEPVAFERGGTHFVEELRRGDHWSHRMGG